MPEEANIIPAYLKKPGSHKGHISGYSQTKYSVCFTKTEHDQTFIVLNVLSLIF